MLPTILCLLNAVATQGNIKDTTVLRLHCKYNIAKISEKKAHFLSAILTKVLILQFLQQLSALGNIRDYYL